MVCDRRREEAAGGGTQDTESKTRTPHKVVGKKIHEAQTSQNLSVTVSLWFQVSALSTSFNLDTNASEWSKKSGRLTNISKKYVDEPSK